MTPAPLARPAGLPADCAPYRRTADFTEVTTPKGLLNDHTTKAGVWGVIHVLEGELLYAIVDPREPAREERLTPGGPPGVVRPTILHKVLPLGRVRFFVEFHRAPDRPAAPT